MDADNKKDPQMQPGKNSVERPLTQANAESPQVVSGHFDAAVNPANPQPEQATPDVVMSANSLAIANPPKNHKMTLVIVGIMIVLIGVLAGGYFFIIGQYKAGDPNDTATWKKYTNVNEGFSAVFIQKPTQQTKKSGNLNTETFLSKSSDNQNEYSVGVFTGSSNVTQADLKSFTNGLIGALKNSVTQKQEKKTIDGRNVIDLTFSGDYNGQQEVFTTRSIVKDNKIYEAFTIGYDNSAINSSYFLNHFKVL